MAAKRETRQQNRPGRREADRAPVGVVVSDKRRFRVTVGAILLVAALSVLSGCNRGKQEPAPRTYHVRGIVRGISPDRTTIDIEHEAIPGFMPSMTMPFSAADPNEVAHFNADDAVSFELLVTEKEATVKNIRRIAAAEVHLPTPSPPVPSTSTITSLSPRLKEGDEMPVFTLTNERGEKITLDSFRGRPFVLTFIYTRCPLPNFCPRISRDFAALQDAIEHGAGPLAETRLLSITLDPKFDTPQVLSAYGKSENADPKIWSFATGDSAEIDALTQAFAVYRQNEGGTLSHGLATALVTSGGKVAKLWRGNGWTPAEVTAAIAHLNGAGD
ncbi:MAG: SCO family protein [Verrucomicrobia bacterium]|nr:SCO family protein [Verrucomicrobiota bacterium]